jgi:hypothetical protein
MLPTLPFASPLLRQTSIARTSSRSLLLTLTTSTVTVTVSDVKPNNERVTPRVPD